MAIDLTPRPSGPEFRVEAGTNRQRVSTVATLADGGFVVAWEDDPYTTGSVDVFAQRYAADGTSSGGKFTVNTTLRDTQQSATVTALADGGFLVAWYGYGQASGTAHGNYAQRYAADGARVGGEFALGGSEVVALANGGFLAISTRFNHASADSGYDIYARRHAADGTPVGGEFRVNAAIAEGQWTPAVATLADGGFVVAWETLNYDDPEAPDIYARRFAADGTPVGGEFQVNTTTAGTQNASAVAGLADGGFVVSWIGVNQPGGASTDIYAQRFAADGSPAGGEFRVNSRTAGLQEAPAVAGLPDGGFVVSWAGSNPALTGRDIYAQRFAADGARVGGEFGVNAATAKEEFRPAIAATADNGFVVAWESGAWLRREATEVRVQRFDAPTSGIAAEIASADPSKPEGDSGATAFAFTVSLAAPAAAAESVGWRVAGFGAHPVEAADFAGGALPSGTLVFAPGETSKTVVVSVAGDAAAESDEAFRVFFAAPTAGLSPIGQGVVATIFGDDLTAVRGTAGADVFAHAPDGRAYDGLGGRDALDAGSFGFRGADVSARPDGGAFLAHGDHRALLLGVEEVRLADGRLVFDAADPAAQVARLYEAALDRLPDQGGLNFWIGAVQGGQPLSALAAGFLASGEFAARFGGAGTTNGAFVDRLYQNVLGRAGEQGGLDFWVGSLDRGAGRADVLVAFSESAENKAGTAALVQNGIWDRSEAATEVARLYDTVFGRLPDAGGLIFWKNALEGGTATLAQMADAFTGSAEFRGQYGALNNRQFADALYVNSLDRPSDQAGLDFWTAQLDAGAPRAAVVLAFSESPEHVNLTAKNIQSENPSEFGILFA